MRDAVLMCAETLWLTGHSGPGVTGLMEAVWLPFILIAGCPGGQSRMNVPPQGGDAFRFIM